MDLTAAAPEMHCDVHVASPCGTFASAPTGMEDLWPRICELLLQQKAVVQDERAVQAQQRGMICDGYLLMPSVLNGGLDDRCTKSWFHEYQFYYEFGEATDERYFWISGQLDRGYALETLWFPDRSIAITNFAAGVDVCRLTRFREMLRQSPPKAAWGEAPASIARVAVHGFQHLMHMMWNQLPALDALLGTSLPEVFSIAVLCEPFGPTAALFPELASILRSVRYEDMQAENAHNGLVLGLGSWTITPGTQDRVRGVALQLATSGVVERRDHFKSSHRPIFWISVKPPKRTMSNQAETLAALIAALKTVYPKSGFILDGASLPWDFPDNSNYPAWFHVACWNAIVGSAIIIDAVLALLDPVLRSDVVPLNNLSACDEVVWGEAASFYVCHGGTMQNKIGWIHRIPGFIHSNHSFLESCRSMPPPVPKGPKCFYASETLIVDDKTEYYSVVELARKDENYSFSSIPALITEISTATLGLGISSGP